MNNEPKSRRAWLETLPSPIKEWALSNCYNPSAEEKSLCDTMYGLEMDNSKEDYRFWVEVALASEEYQKTGDKMLFAKPMSEYIGRTKDWLDFQLEIFQNEVATKPKTYFETEKF